jgi:hypothetical protein
MRRLEIDYVASPRRPRWVGPLVLVLACLIAGEILIRYRDARAELAALESEHGVLNVGRAPAKALPRERLEEQSKAVNEIVRKLSLPWAQMISAVEKASNGEVAILQMQPEAQQRLLRLTAEAKSQKAMLQYVERLEQNPTLADVHLVRHEVQQDHPARPIQFAVQATLKEAR